MKTLDKYLMLGIFVLNIILWSGVLGAYPWGDVDASTHFALSDFQSSNNSVMYGLPYYIDEVYGRDNAHKIWYPPQFHLSGAIVQYLSGSRFVSLEIYWLVLSCLGSAIIFYVVSKFFGTWAALFAAVLSIFSYRDYWSFLVGLWPERASYVLFPLVIYTIYRYFTGEKKFIYLYALLIGCQYWFHPQGAFISGVASVVLTVLFIIKDKKLPFKFKEVVIPFIIVLIMVLPFIGASLQWKPDKMMKTDSLSSLVEWYPFEVPYSPDLGSFVASYGWYFLPFLILGLAYCIKKRNLYFIAMFISLYICYHLGILGVGGRTFRFVTIEGMVFWPLIAGGFYFLSTWLEDKLAMLLFIGLSATVLVLGIMYVVPNISDAYPAPFMRLNDAEIQAMDWVRENVPEDDNILLIGNQVYSKRKWMRVVSQRYMLFDDVSPLGKEAEGLGTDKWVFIDLSEYPEKPTLDFFNRSSLLEVYNKNDIVIFKRTE